jgi:ubiquinone biosynthesis protein COQ9
MAHLARALPKRAIPFSLTSYIRQTPTLSTALPLTRTPATKRTPLTLRRTYHSTLHPRLPDHEYTNSQTAILTASLAHVQAHGFTPAALTLGARDAGFLDVSVQLLPRGEFDLILFWLASRRGLLRGKVEEGGLFRRIAAEKGKDVHELKIEERIRGLLLERLRMNGEVKDVWQDVGTSPMWEVSISIIALTCF